MKNLIIALLCFIAPQLYAQGVLTFEQAIQHTLANNFNIRIERNNAQQIANNNNAGSAGYLPTITANADQFFSSTNTRQEFYSGQINEKNGAKNQSLTANLRLDWTIFDGFAMFAADKRLQLQEDQATLQVQAQMEMYLYQTAVLYYSIVFQNRMNAVYKDALELSQERFRIVQLKAEKGALSELELIQARLDMNTDSSNLIAHNKTIRDLKTELAAVMGNSSNVNFEVEDLDPGFAAVDENQVLADAREQNTSVLVNKAQIAIVDAQRKEMQGRYYPQVALYGQYSFTNSQSQVGLLASNRSLGPGFGFTLSWTILDNLSTFTQLKNLDLQRENAELAVESNNQQIEKEVKLAMSNYNYAKELYALENSAVINTEEIFKIAQQTYEAGSMTDLELREFQFSVVQAKNRQLSAALSMKTAELNLNLMTGNFKNLIK